MLLFLLLLFAGTNMSAVPIQEAEQDGPSSRKILGSSVVTSVSVIMDAGGAQTHFSDAVGRPVAKPHTGAQVASPIDLLNPDRYEFYTFDDNGDLVKRLMTLDEIQGIIANSDGELLTNYNAQQQSLYMPEKKVNDVVNTVQNVLKEEIESHKNNSDKHPLLDTPDVSATWSMILPAVFGNSGEDIKLDQVPQQTQQTPETIVFDNTIPPTRKPLGTTTVLESASEILSQLITQVQTEKSNLDTPVITVAIVSRRPTPSGSLEVLNDGTEQYLSSLKPLDEATTNKFLQLFKPLTTQQILKTAPPSTTTVPNKYLAVFLPQQTKIYPVVSTKRPVSSSSSSSSTHIRPTTFRPASPYVSTKVDVTKKPSPFKPTRPAVLPSTPEPLINRKPSPQFALNVLPSTLADFIKQKLTTYSSTTSVSTTKKNQSPGAQFVVQDEFVKGTTGKRRVPIISSTTPLSTTRRTTTAASVPFVQIISHSTPSLNNEELISSSSSYYGGSTLPSSTINKNKVSYPSAATQVLETITKKVNAISTAILDKISSTTLAEEQAPTETTYPDRSTTLDYTNIPQLGSTAAQLAEITVPQLLDKLLLTSTNIYNLNNELVDKKGTTLPFVTTVVPTDATTNAEPNLLASIEELISQTINDPNNHITDHRQEIEKISTTTTTTTTEDVLSTTILPNQEHNDDDEGASAYDILNQSVGSLLSQVVNSEKQTFTTLSDFIGGGGGGGTTTDDLMKRTIPANELPDISTNPDRIEDVTTEDLLKLGSTELTPTTSAESTTLTSESDVIFSNNNLELLKTEASSSYQGKEHPETTEEVVAEATEIFTKIESTTLVSTEQQVEVVMTTTQAAPTTYRPSTYQANKVPTVPLVVTKPPTLKYYQTTPKTTTVINDDGNWKLVSTLAPNSSTTTDVNTKPVISIQSPKPVELVPQPVQGFSLEDTTANLDKDISEFVTLCNELAFGFWNSVTTGISSARSVFVSPFAATSLLAMVFLGARGSTSGEMNEILRLDDMVTFNPHMIFKNVSESIAVDPKNGIATSVIARELYSDRSKGQLLNFYKERARQFYEGHVEEAGFKEIGDVIRRRTNLIVKRQTNGRIPEFVKDSSFTVRPPLAGVSVSIFQTDCTNGSTDGRDGELYFVVLPTIRQRRLIPVPATVYRTGFLAGYEPSLDATAVSIGSPDQLVSTVFVIPGQQGIAAPGDGLARLEKHLMESAFKQNSWSRLLKSLIPRPGLEVQIPRFSHRSVINATVALKHMGLRDLFDSDKADLRGLNGVANELYLSDIIQLNNFATCGEGTIGDQHHSEIYPATANRTFRRYRRLRITHSSEEGISSSEDDDLDLDGAKPLASASALVEALYLADEPRDYQRAFHDPLHDPSLLSLPLSLRPRQARIPEPPRLRFDRPFLYFVRHNPTGLVLHMGRFNPRLLP